MLVIIEPLFNIGKQNNIMILFIAKIGNFSELISTEMLLIIHR